MPKTKSIAPDTLTTTEIAKTFAIEEDAWALLERLRWPHGAACPFCGCVGNATYITPKSGYRNTRAGNVTYRRIYQCRDRACGQQFSVLVGTVMEDTHIPVSKWLMAMHLILISSAKNGVSAHELHRELGITYKSAWFLAHRIRYAMERPSDAVPLIGTVESDETYIGGEAKNMHKADRERRIHGRGPSGKTPVVSLVERGGQVRSQVIVDVSRRTLGALLRRHVDPSAALMTDAAGAYEEVGREFASHQTVNHSAGEYVRGDVHTNTAEGYFSQLKRSIDGTYHHVSEQHLHRYLSEFDLRYICAIIVGALRTARGPRR